MPRNPGRVALVVVAWGALAICALMAGRTGWLLARTSAYAALGRDADAVVITSVRHEAPARSPRPTTPAARYRGVYRFDLPDGRGGRVSRHGDFETADVLPGVTPVAVGSRMRIQYLPFHAEWSRPAAGGDGDNWLVAAVLFFASVFGAGMCRVLLQLLERAR